jgi:hypothetical protein
VTSISSPIADGSYHDGDVIPIIVTFSEPVAVDGAPFLVLNDIGGSHTTPTATYVGGSGTNTIAFTYTVASGNQTDLLDCANAGALRLGTNGAIRDTVNPATLTVPVGSATGALAANKAIAVNPGPPGGKLPATTVATARTSGSGCGLGGGAALLGALALGMRRRRR